MTDQNTPAANAPAPKITWRQKGPNKAIGTVACPLADCDLRAAVHRFSSAGKNGLSGKLYAVCPDHGRLFADGRQSGQEWLLDRAIIFGPAGAPAPAVAAVAAVAAPVAAVAAIPAGRGAGLLIE